jgi:VanZ family protein
LSAELATALRRAPAPLALMALIFVLSAQPDLDTGLGVWDEIGREFAHVGEYLALTLLWIWALAPVVSRPAIAAASISLLYAISDEWHQSFVEGRGASVFDVGMDALGVALAVVLSLRVAAARTG